MPLRRTKRSDGRHRPRWKDGSHAKVENTDAEQSRCDRFVLELNTHNEPLETVQSLLELNHELNVSTRDRPAKTGADARIEESGAIGEVRLALRPYGRKKKACPSSLVHIHPKQPFEARASSDGAAHRRAGMQLPPPSPEVRSTAVPESPFLARDGFGPRGSTRHTIGSLSEVGAR